MGFHNSRNPGEAFILLPLREIRFRAELSGLSSPQTLREAASDRFCSQNFREHKISRL